MAKKLTKKSVKKTVKKQVKKVIVKPKTKNKPKKKPKVDKKVKTPKKRFEGKLVGRISHYFSDIEVAVVKLSSPLKIGDTIRIACGQETDFNQKVKSMQIDHEPVKLAKKGASVGMKMNKKVHDGYKVFKI